MGCHSNNNEQGWTPCNSANSKDGDKEEQRQWIYALARQSIYCTDNHALRRYQAGNALSNCGRELQEA